MLFNLIRNLVSGGLLIPQNSLMGIFYTKESNLGDTAFQCVIPYSLFMLEVGLVLSDSTDVTLLS